MSDNHHHAVTTARDTLILQYVVKLQNIEEEKNDLDMRKAYLISDLAERLLANGYAEEETIFSLLCVSLKNTVDMEMIVRSLPEKYVKKSIVSATNLENPDVQDKIKMRIAHKIVTYDNLLEEIDVLKKAMAEDVIRIRELVAMLNDADKKLFKQDRLLDKVSMEYDRLKKRLQQKDRMVYVEACDAKAIWHMMVACVMKEKAEPKFNPSGERTRKIIFDIALDTGKVEGCHLEP